MDVIRITGPNTGDTYEAHDTGETWNGSPVLAFTMSELIALIRAGDGADSNGYGLQYLDGDIVDVIDDDQVDPVPTLIRDVRGDTLVLYVPQGRTWDIGSAGDMTMRTPTLTELVVGAPYTATVTGKNHGRQFYRQIEFTAARATIEEEFVATSEVREDRIFVQHWEQRLNRSDSWPELVVSGSIRERR